MDQMRSRTGPCRDQPARHPGFNSFARFSAAIDIPALNRTSPASRLADLERVGDRLSIIRRPLPAVSSASQSGRSHPPPSNRSPAWSTSPWASCCPQHQPVGMARQRRPHSRRSMSRSGLKVKCAQTLRGDLPGVLDLCQRMAFNAASALPASKLSGQKASEPQDHGPVGRMANRR